MLTLNSYESLSIRQTENLSTKSTGYFFWKDRNHRYLGGNNTAHEFMHVSSTKELIGLTDLDLGWLEGGHTGLHFQHIDKQVMNGKTITNEKEILLKPNEQGKIMTKVIVVSKRPLLHNGRCLGVVLEAMDITHLVFPTLLNNPSPINHAGVFTHREIDCIRFLLCGYSYKRIATQLSLSPRTVEYYIENIKNKLSCNNKQQLIDKLSCMGYLPSRMGGR